MTQPMGGAAPPEAGILPEDVPATERARDAAQRVAGTASAQAGTVAGVAGEQTREVASTATDAASQIAGTAVEKAAEVRDEATAQVRNLLHDTTTQVRSQADAQTAKAAESLAGLGDQLRALAEGRPGDAEAVAHYLQQGAEKLGGLAERLQRDGLDGAVSDVSRFARRRPGVFLLGALGVGFGVGRLLRSGQANGTIPTPSLPGSSSPTEVRGTLAVPGADGYEVPVSLDETATLPLNVPIPPEVEAFDDRGSIR